MPTGTRLNLTKEFLEREYVERNKSCRQIAKELGCDKKCITSALKSFEIPIKKRAGHAPYGLIGRKFGLLFVEEYAGDLEWRCKCECGNVVVVLGHSLKNGHTRSCGCLKTIVNQRRASNVGGLIGQLWYRIQKGADQRGLEFSISQEECWELFIKQGGRCALSGVELTLPQNANELHAHTYTGSLDRIDSTRGYIASNIQWVHKHVNLMKMAFDETYFIRMCKKIAEHRKDD